MSCRGDVPCQAAQAPEDPRVAQALMQGSLISATALLRKKLSGGWKTHSARKPIPIFSTQGGSTARPHRFVRTGGAFSARVRGDERYSSRHLKTSDNDRKRMARERKARGGGGR